MAYRMKGAPMKRNFGIGKPGAPSTGEFVEDNSAGFATNNNTNENAGIVNPPPVVDNNAATETNESYLDKEGINKDGTSKLPERNDGLKGGLLDNWIRKNQGKSFREILGLSKEQIAERKANKNAKIEAAKSAVGSGTETLKQAKLVERNRKKTNRKAKRKIKKDAKDKKKLVEYRKKNPVRGKEAINLFVNQTKNS